MQPTSDINIWGVISLGALIGGIGSTIVNFGIEIYKAKITLDNDILKKRHELRDQRRLDAYEKLYKELIQITLIQPNDTNALITQIEVIHTFLNNNTLYFDHEEKSLVYAFTNYFTHIANPASTITKNVATEEQHLEGIAQRFITHK